MRTTTPVSNHIVEKDFIVSEIETFIEQGGPRAHEYAYADYLFEEAGRKFNAGELPAEVRSKLLQRWHK